MSTHIEQVKKFESNQKLLSESSIDAIWTLDAETLKYEYMTESIKKMSGYGPDEYINRSASERLTPQSFQKITKILAQELPKFEKGIKKTRAIEVQLIHKNGQKYWALIKAKLFKEPGGKLKIIGVTREISDLRLLKRQKEKLIKEMKDLTSKNDKLLKENEILKQFIPKCSKCNKFCDENGSGWTLSAFELYLKKRKKKNSNGTLCNDCKDHV
ncbi:PAS domain S-box protein [Desulfospira joergensenii]|uniref:PAS domain S-box protein n=1 Tax=Desulfospira joergensenii TaxID=53329 RepID=UPI0012947C84|nr:PAS domain S-box protein [Desulfospira joergensenii]